MRVSKRGGKKVRFDTMEEWLAYKPVKAEVPKKTFVASVLLQPGWADGFAPHRGMRKKDGKKYVTDLEVLGKGYFRFRIWWWVDGPDQLVIVNTPKTKTWASVELTMYGGWEELKKTYPMIFSNLVHLKHTDVKEEKWAASSRSIVAHAVALISGTEKRR